MAGLAVVRDLREMRAVAGPEEIERFETDVVAGFVLARAAAGLSDHTIGTDVSHLEQLRSWFGRPLFEMAPDRKLSTGDGWKRHHGAVDRSLKSELSRLPIAELFAGARTEIAEADLHDPVPYLVALHERPTEEVFHRAVVLLSDLDPEARELGAMVLRELGALDEAGRRPFSDRAVPVLLDRIRQERDPRVLGWVISALKFNGAQEALTAVLSCAQHPHWRVRFHVAAAISWLVDPEHIEADALRALLLLCRDEYADTRYYALVALVEEVSGIDADSVCPTINDLLEDPDEQVREVARGAETSICTARPR